MDFFGFLFIVAIVVLAYLVLKYRIQDVDRKARTVADEVSALEARVSALSRRLTALARDVGGPAPGDARVAAPAGRAAVPAAAESGAAATQAYPPGVAPAPPAAAPVVLPQAAGPGAERVTVAAPGVAVPVSQPPGPAAPPPAAAQALPPQAAPLPPAPAVPPPARPAGPPAPARAAGAVPSPPVGARPPSPPPPEKPAFDWEGIVGVKLFSWVAAIALLVAAVSFLRYGIEHGWLQPPVRMAIGIVTGIALLVVCELKAARKYAITANALDAGAIAVLFATFYASNALWKLVPTLPAFLLMALVTAVAVALSVRRDSMFIALLGLVGGFATPILMSTGEDRTLALFSYLLLLNLGLAWVAYRKKWPVLTLCSVALTAIYQWGWVMKFFNEDRMASAALIFLVFPIAAVAALALGRPRGERAGEGELFEQSTLLAVGLPVLLAIYLAAVPRFGANFWLLFGFLFCVVAGMFAVAVWRGPQELHAVGAVSTLLVFAIWSLASYGPAAWPGIVAIITLFVAFYLAAPIAAERLGRPLEPPLERTALAAPFLLAMFPQLIAKEPACAVPEIVFGSLFLLLAACALYAVKRSAGEVYHVGAAAAVLAEVVWSAKYLAADTLTAALIVYAAFAALFVVVSVVATRASASRRATPAGLVLLNASLLLLMFLAAPSVAPVSFAGMVVLLVLFNMAVFREAFAGGPMWLALIASALSWFVLGTWWFAARGAADAPAVLVASAGLALLMAGGYIWVGRRTGTFTLADNELPANSGAYFALIGHAFVLGVAASPSLNIPPWPWLAVMAILDAALGVAALYIGTCWLFGAAAVFSQLVLLSFALTAKVAPWPAVAVLASGGVAALALAWLPAWARRFGARGAAGTAQLAATACVVVFMAQAVAIASTGLPGRPSLGLLIPFHIACVGVLLAMAWRREWHVLAPLAAASSALAVSAWTLNVTTAVVGSGAWQSRLLFAGALYVPFILYPLLLGRRVASRTEPHLAAVLASAVFFFVGWKSFLDAGWKDVIGILPIGQAIILCILLLRVLRIEPQGKRTQGRLALVAGAALAFVTVAIPLQFEKEWITLAWALEAAALAWLYTKVRHEGLHFTSMALACTAFVRLALNQATLSYYPRTGTPVFNWFLYAYLLAAVALFVAAFYLRRTDDRLAADGPRSSHVLRVLATVLLFLLLNIEIADTFSQGAALTFRLMGGSLQQDLAYTLGWACFAICVLAAGVYFRSRAARVASIVLLTVTALKAFLHDLAQLGGLYRVASFVGLALSLALVAVALQKFVLAKTGEADR